jgi:hypothetical protein
MPTGGAGGCGGVQGAIDKVGAFIAEFLSGDIKAATKSIGAGDFIEV